MFLKMSSLFYFLFFFAVAFAAPPFRQENDKHWEMFKMAFRKNYTSFEELARRLIFEKNLARIIQHNIEADFQMHDYKLEINHLSDMAKEEYAMLNGFVKGNKTTKPLAVFLPPSNVEYPKEVDWRKMGLVTKVKDQGKCGSCWAFSTTGSLEGQHKKKSGRLLSLSEQNLVDCSNGNAGCDGGMMDKAFEYVKTNDGIDTEAAYPYIGKKEFCRFRKQAVGATLSGYVDIPEGDEDALMKAVATVGPVSVAIDADHFSFQSYSHGIYNEEDCSSENLNHGVLIVGYGTENGKDFWIVKNSWSKNWGENGYIRMARNKNNQCGIASLASYPLV